MYLNSWIESSETKKTFEDLRDLFAHEQFVDACPKKLAVIDNTALLAEKAEVKLRCVEIKALCTLDAICVVIIGKLEEARGSEDPDLSVMVDEAIKLQQEDPGIKGFVGAKKTARRGNRTASFEKIKGFVCRRFNDLGSNICLKQVILPKSLPGSMMLVANDSITEALFGIRGTKVLSNIY
ncbi:hypothetical protein PoB_001823400 [Plakobranchus ocellatus]|uniref:Uncharacterized protein n=1 Tax=Plakobranchus ocellatus TaxID=259542 RepID=A0AAV3ZBF9_9GAST|nr:hypothetical protein PoB_001823400 [Plakobranchus ocellatus]